MSTKERNLDTRRKIQFGELVIEAGLGNEELAVILGVLIAGGRVLNSKTGTEARLRWKQSGEQAFGVGLSQ
jgi:hypothetical protein